MPPAPTTRRLRVNETLARLSAVLYSLDVLGLALLLGLQLAAWHRSGRRSLLALAISTACALLGMLICTLARLMIQDEDVMNDFYLLGDASVLLQLLTLVGGSALLMRHYLELLQTPHADPPPGGSLLQAYGLSPAAAFKVINWSVIGLVLAVNAVAWFFYQLPFTATWLLLIPAGFMLRSLQPHGQGLLSRGCALLLNVLAAGGGWFVFLNCLVSNPEPIRGCMLSMVLAAAPLGANSLYLLRGMRRTGAA